MHKAHKDVVAYSSGFKWLHWLVAVLMLLMLAVGFLLSDMPADIKAEVYMLHKSTGLTILGLMLVRVIWVLGAGRPRLPDTMSRSERVLAYSIQYGLYVLIIGMSISGWMMSTASNKVPIYFNGFRIPFPGLAPNEAIAALMYQTHQVIAWALVVLVSLHILGALKHWLIDKDDILQRMLP